MATWEETVTCMDKTVLAKQITGLVYSMVPSCILWLELNYPVVSVPWFGPRLGTVLELERPKLNLALGLKYNILNSSCCKRVSKIVDASANVYEVFPLQQHLVILKPDHLTFFIKYFTLPANCFNQMWKQNAIIIISK